MHQFDQDTLLAQDEPFSFSGHITENWSINEVPDGGYLMAILAKAMMHHCEKRSTPIITANYLSRCEPGEARILIERMAASKQFERFQADLHQSGLLEEDGEIWDEAGRLIAISRQIAQYRAITK